jgi:flagellin-like protein
MKRKGISPLIAAVLLIAFTMAVASIFAQWAPQLIEDAQGDTSEQAQNIQECSDRTLNVNVDTDDEYIANIQQTGGNDGVGNLTVTWYWEDENPTQNETVADQKADNSAIKESTGLTSIDSGILSEDRNLTEVQVQTPDCEGAPGGSWEAP